MGQILTHLAGPDYLAASVVARVMAPPPPADLNRWAVDHVEFGAESQFRGPYDPDRFPFFRRILEVLGPDHPARTVVLMKGSQLGGTVIAQIFLAACMDLDPGYFLYVLPTEGNALRWAQQKWRPMIRRVDRLGEIFYGTVTKEAGNSLLFQERRDGQGALTIGGAASQAALAMITARYQVHDDLGIWENNADGDTETQADERSKAVEDAKIFKIGKPTLEDSCKITRNWKASTQEHYRMPCPHCGHEQAFEWENFRIPDDAVEAAHFVCPDCGGVIEQHHRADMLRRGRWVADKPDSATVGFHLWTAYSPLTSWADMAADWLRVRGDPSAEQSFVNGSLGRPWKVRGKAPPWEAIRDRAAASERPRREVPRGALILVISMDCQSDRVEWHLKGFGRDLRRWTIEYGVIDGHISDAATWEALDSLIGQTWRDWQGRQRPIDKAVIDAGAWTTDVHDWARRHPISRVMMIRGTRGDNAPPLARVQAERRPNGKTVRYGGRFFNVGTSGIKLSLYKCLEKTDPLERGYCDYPAGLDDEFFVQLTSEQRRPRRLKNGGEEYIWWRPPNVRNEVLDTEVYAEACAINLRWRHMTDAGWDALEAEREAPLPPGTQLDLEDTIATTAGKLLDVLQGARGAAPLSKPASTPSKAKALVRRMAG